ncbi:MAG TPA: redox-regulated ATPase YchF, partial [Firmicutes bacterium]|nr:redox-regulated ATPase YchF [Bacillota bacterium]
PDPFKEISDLASELLLADMAFIENRLERITEARKPPKDAELQVAVLEKILTALEDEQPVGSVPLNQAELLTISGHNFFSEKPLIIAVNLDQDQFASGDYPEREKVLDYASRLNLPVIEACALIEAEISELSPEDRPEFLEDLGITEPGISRLARVAYERLGLISFFTIGEDEVRAWSIRRGIAAKQAAGKVHTDMERGFIRAETVHFEDLFALGSVAKAREKGLIRLEGKDYQVQDGDIINFRFNV